MQSNLAWMAAAADANREVGTSISTDSTPLTQYSQSMNMALPVMQAPAGVDFVSMDRIYQLYATLPTIFANDVIRKNQAESTAANRAPARSVSPTVSLKRDRTEEMPTEMVSKRRDTGDGKLSSLPQGNFPPIAPSISPPTIMQPPPPPMPSSSMPPPSQIPSNPAQQPDLRRQNPPPMRAPPPPQQQFRSNPPPNMRQSSPPGPSNSGMPGPIPSNTPNPSNPAPSGNQQTPNALANQYYQVLQNPNHPMTQYLNNTIPNFQTLPIQTQIGKLHQMQVSPIPPPRLMELSTTF